MIEITNENFAQVVQENELTLIDFWATWCGPCKIVIPMLEEAEPEFEGVTFAKSDIDKAAELAGEFDIMSVPTVVLLRNGKEFARGSGINGVNGVIAILREAV